MSSRPPLPVLAALGVSGALIAAFVVRALTGFGGEGVQALFVTHVYDAAKALAGAALLARALRPGPDRAAWALLGVGVLLGMVGDVLWSRLYAESGTVPVPSVADVFYLAAYVPMVAAALLLLRDRRVSARSGVGLDGLASVLAVATIFAALVLQPIGGSVAGAPAAELATTLAYPLADLLLLGGFVTACALRGWRMDARWGVLCAGALGYVVADSAYLLQVLDDGYVAGRVLDAGWLLPVWLWAAVAWSPVRPAARPAGAWERPTRASALAPVLLGAIATVAFLVEALEPRADRPTLLLAFATALAIFVRLGLTSADNVRLLAASRAEAVTDALTGLGNRRALDAELRRLAGERRALVLFDLDGFKAYNDTFGHPAGDRLLIMIGDALRRAVAGSGAAFRMGGDEFCAIVDPGEATADGVGRRLAATLVQTGHGFHVGASYGAVMLPGEASEPGEALRVADRRLYASKRGGRGSAPAQSSDVLLAMLSERHPELGTHVDHVALLAGDLAVQLGLPPLAVDDVRRAAALHDVGKVAIPERVLGKPGPLEGDELRLMRQHTIIGERVISAAPALSGVAAIVRASHERWDGGGYPDGLAGAAIPLGARIVFVCDAFDAMTTDRPYQAAMSPAEALQELRRCAGTQFDPDVVEAFAAALAERGALAAAA